MRRSVGDITSAAMIALVISPIYFYTDVIWKENSHAGRAYPVTSSISGFGACSWPIL